MVMQARHDRQRSIWVTTCLSAGRSFSQHVLDQVDASARAVELVAERHIGRACRGAETAMHAFPQDLFGFGDPGIGELLGGEIRLHIAVTSGLSLFCARAGSRHPDGGDRRVTSGRTPGCSEQPAFAGCRWVSLRPSFCRPMMVRMMIQSATRTIVSMPISTTIRRALTNAPSRPNQNVRIAQV